MTQGLPTRERILEAARRLFQQRGYHGVGTADILEAARAPKGSMYHHFPNGKEQIAIAVVRAIQDDVTATLDKLVEKKSTAAEIVRRLARGMAAWLKATQWRQGTMLASMVIGPVPDLPGPHAAIKEALDQWYQRLAQLLVREGWSHADARVLTRTVIAGLEGVTILARIEGDERVVTQVAERLASLVSRDRPHWEGRAGALGHPR